MSDIPSDIFLQILLRVPVDSLLRFRAVCKSWRRLIDDPSFIRSHTSNQISSTTLVIRNSIGTRLYSLSLDSINYSNDAHQVIDVIPVKTLYRTGGPRIPDLPVPSCNGLMLLSHYYVKKTWAVWNPSTREFHELPKSDIEDSRIFDTGLGYDCAYDDYKVVRIDKFYRHDKIVYKTRVYSLKMESWKMIEDFSCDVPMLSPSNGVFLNGALYWRLSDCVIALNLRTERYHKLPLPPCPGSPFETHLDALGGCLVLSHYYLMKRIDGWVRKNYGGGDIWVKFFSFDELYGSGAMWSLRPVAYFKSKGQVILQHDCGFFMLDIVKGFAKKFTINGLPDKFSSQIFPESLFRLGKGYDVAVKSTAGVKRKRQRQRKKDNTRFKHSVTITDVSSHSYPSWWNDV